MIRLCHGFCSLLACANRGSYDPPVPCIARILAFPLACLLIFFAAGCSKEPPATPKAHAPGADEMRLVTVAPALSQMLVDLGLSDRIVGVAEYENAAPPGLPIVGNYNAVNTEMLLATRPTHVLMMVGPSGAPSRLRDLADDGLFALHTFPMPLSVADITGVLASDDTQVIDLGEALGMREQADALKQHLLTQLGRVADITSSLEKPKVLMVLGTEPTVMASGPGTVHDELLGYAGGRNAAHDAVVTAPEYDRESLLALAPDVILLLQPDAPAITDNDPRLAPFADLSIPRSSPGGCSSSTIP